MTRFLDRREAGLALGGLLSDRSFVHPVVLGLPRGGAPVADEVARLIDAPLDVLVVRKLGMPGHEELAMGAVGEGGSIVLNREVITAAGISAEQVGRAEMRERAEVERRTALFRDGRPRIPLVGREAIVVDDGLATGATARAACRVARAQGAERIVLAVPVAPHGTSEAFDEADETFCLTEPRDFMSVGMHYVDFTQVDDGEVTDILRSGRE